MRDTIDMAREVYGAHTEWKGAPLDRLEQLVALVRADERKQVALDKKAENARELGLDYEPVTILPDGSAFGVMSFPLPDDHWLYAPNEYRDGEYEPIDLPKPILTHALREAVVAAVRYAVRGATMRGKETDFDPDALVQNAVYALCGPYTTPTAQPAPVQEPVAMRMPKVGDKVVCIEDESLGTVVYLTAGGSPEIKFDDGSHGTYMLREFAELFGYTTPPAAQRTRVGLTDDELADIWYKQSLDWMEFARAIEAAHGIKEKNT
jgi:hypothetical protein